MKKTLVALMALAGMACAAEIGENITLGSYFTNQGEKIMAVDAIAGQSSVSGLKLGNLAVKPGTQGISYTVTVGDLLTSSTISDSQLLRLDSFVFMSRNNGNNTGSDRYITVQVGNSETVYTSAGMVVTRPTNYGYETLTFASENAPTFSLSDTLKVTVYSTSGDTTFGFGGIAENGATITSGSSFSVTGGDSKTYYQAIKLNATVMTPEPATATLSLLALAGLASRRRRH